MKSPAFVMLLAAVAACGGSSPASNPQQTSLGVAQAGDLRIELLTDSRLEVGLNALYASVTSISGSPLGFTPITVTPLMTMADGKQHGAPVIVAEGLYGCFTVFSMPSSAVDTWSVKVTAQPQGGSAVSVVFDRLAVAETGRAKSFTFTDPATLVTTKYLLSLNFTAAPRVGLNPVLVTLHRMQDMMTFVPVDDAAIALDPQMPAMGHGSPGSIDPMPTSVGRYEGKLSFSMPGEWETRLTVKLPSGQMPGAVTVATTF
jgi:hypothetical protein